MQQRVFAFDFDGTLTTCDTFPAFIRYACGTRAFIAGFMLHAPLLILMKLHLYPNHKAKRRIFAHFFSDMTAVQFNAVCSDFARSHRHLLRPEPMSVLRQAVADGHRVMIISASIENWVTPFFDDIRPAAPGTDAVTVAGTKIEVCKGHVTGRFITPNCYGPEKVRRLLELLPDRQSYHLTAFGDSRGDRELLAMADKAYYKGRLQAR